MRKSIYFLLLGVGCGPTTSTPTPTPSLRTQVEVSHSRPERVPSQGLENLFRVRDGLFSGGQPDGDTGFADLHKLGVKTIISVDGVPPDVARARALGMKYVHLPVGYDGIPQDRAWAIARAVRDLPGPVYVHCHHGKHRGPAAVAAALLCVDPEFKEKDAHEWMTAAGTDTKYRGLVELPKRLALPKPGELDRVSAAFPESAAVDDLTAAMVKIDERWEYLKTLRRKEPFDSDAATVAADMLAEHYREAARTTRAKAKGPGFITLFETAHTEMSALAKAIRDGETGMFPARFSASGNQCVRCHTKHRD